MAMEKSIRVIVGSGAAVRFVVRIARAAIVYVPWVIVDTAGILKVLKTWFNSVSSKST